MSFTIELPHPYGGDGFERAWWSKCARTRFPGYEVFWARRVVPLTGRDARPPHIRFKTREELATHGYTDEDVTIAQLHYTLLMHLGVVFELLDAADAFRIRAPLPGRRFGGEDFFHAFARLSGASDVADELLGRNADRERWEPWNEDAGAAARRSWRDRNPDDPLRPIRDYRNRLVHGRVVPGFRLLHAHGAAVVFYPGLERVDAYVDWRVAFVYDQPPPDFEEAAMIVLDAWESVVEYVEDAWRQHLI